MIGLLQRVSEARVEVESRCVASIGRGLLVFVGVQRDDSPATADRLLERLVTYRVFPDADDRMNLSLLDVGGELLLVPQFTLAADTDRGTRAGFSRAAAPDEGRRLFGHLVLTARGRIAHVASGVFGANMRVALVSEGPVTFWLEVSP